MSDQLEPIESADQLPEPDRDDGGEAEAPPFEPEDDDA